MPSFAADRAPLKLAATAPVLDWDNPGEIKTFVEGLQDDYHIDVTWIELLIKELKVSCQ